MKIPNNIEKIITKEGIPYEDLRDIILKAIVVIDEDTWKITIDKLTFPVTLNNEEIFELIEFYYLNEYDIAAYITMNNRPNEILVEGDKHFGGIMLIFTAILFFGVLAFLIMTYL